MRNIPDLPFAFALLALVGFGTLMLTSASSVLGLDVHENPYYFLEHQIAYGILPGIVMLCITMFIPYQTWRRFVVPFILVVLFLLILVFVPAFQVSYGGAARWINIGPLSIQPSEFAKLALILYLAALFSSKGSQVGNVKEGLLPFLFIIGVIGVLIVKQPNVGTLAVVTGAALLMYFAAGARLLHLLGILISAVLIFLLLIHAAPYRLARFTTFLHPELDPKGIGYQVQQSLLAIGSGGFWGLGFGHSRQKFRYLPEPAGDSIFSIAAEELGFFRLALFLGLFTFLIWRGYYIAKRAPDQFGKLVAVGITSWFFVQALIHVGVNLALTPLTGIPFPFVSYGGSALVIALAGAGILLNISRYQKGS